MYYIEPESWSQSNNCSVESVRYVLDKYKHLLKWKKNPSIIELGTGDGNTTERALFPVLPDDVKLLIGADANQRMIDFASSNQKLVSKMKLTRLDVTTDSLPAELEGGFDHVISFHMIHAVHETDRAFVNIFKLLKPGGELFAVCLSEIPIDEPFQKLSQMPRWAKYENHKLISPYYKNPNVVEIYKKKLENCGFLNVMVKPDTMIYDFEDDAEWMGLLHAVNPAIPKIEPDEFQEYFNDYVDYFKTSNCMSTKKNNNGKDILVADLKMLVFHAKKPEAL